MLKNRIAGILVMLAGCATEIQAPADPVSQHGTINYDAAGHYYV